MKITSLRISGFRCFDDAGQTISIDHFTGLVGPNASGKTAALMALVRLFGELPAQRQITPDDFHLGAAEELNDKPQRSLSIECRLDFPELAEPGGSVGDAVPETFRQMIVDAPGNSPFCRIRLEATWTDDGSLSGEVEQSLSWILTNSNDPKVIDDINRRKVQPADRRHIRVVYVPAARDPDKQIAITTTTAFGRLLKNLAWNGTKQAIQEQLSNLQTQIAALNGVATLNEHVQKAWTGLYRGKVAAKIAFRALEEDPSDLLSLLAAHFDPVENGRTLLCKDLSDGQRSLFSLSLSVGLFHLEQAIKQTPATAGYRPELAEDLPLLTIFAVEEPENHLSPQYLGTVVNELIVVASHPNAQVLVSSHSPAILGRIQPDHVRYFLGNEHASSTKVKRIPLPETNADEAFKYVREAVRGHPELYFSRLVILGEGPSEEIVLRRIFEASGTPLDTHFITVVPLGGRHVNHFWRLVHGLEIPHLTLLDLDREKEGAGWGRIQYVRNELIKRYATDSPTLSFTTPDGTGHNLSDEAYCTLAANDVANAESMQAWMTYFENTFGVFFSSPLDIDFAMLESFPAVYTSQAPRGPSLPKPDSPEYPDAVLDRVKQVLSSNPKTAPADTGSTYTSTQRELFSWYKYLFIDGSKPVSHMLATIALSDADLLGKAPAVLSRLVQRAKALVTPAVGAE